MRLAALLTLAIAAALLLRRRRPAPEPDDYAEPVPMAAWDGNSATYLYNARTGVVSSYN